MKIFLPLPRRLERQIEIEKEERMALERANQQLSSGIAERNSAELRVAQATSGELRSERDALRAELQRLEAKVAELQAECASAVAAADTARVQQRHYKVCLTFSTSSSCLYRAKAPNHSG